MLMMMMSLKVLGDDVWRSISDALPLCDAIRFAGTCKRAQAAVDHRPPCQSVAKALCRRLFDYFTSCELVVEMHHTIKAFSDQNYWLYSCTIEGEEAMAAVSFNLANDRYIHVEIDISFPESLTVVVQSELSGELVYEDECAEITKQYEHGELWSEICLIILDKQLKKK